MKSEDRKTGKGLSRDEIKYIAAAAMLLNHIANIFMEPRTFWFEVFRDVGYLTAPVMCYFLVEGYQFTRSRRKYGERLFIFAVLSQFPFCLALSGMFSPDGEMTFCGMNMMFTLLLGFGILQAREKIRDPFLRYAAIGALILCSAFSDWGVLAPIFVLLFAGAQDLPSAKGRAFAAAAVLFGLFNFLGGIGTMPFSVNLAFSLGNMAGPALAAFLILFCYSGRRMERGRVFSKWFFYVFYPLHLLILGIIRISL